MKRDKIDKLIINKQREKERERERLLCTNILIPYKYHIFHNHDDEKSLHIFPKIISKTHATKRFVAPSTTMFFFFSDDDVTFHQQPVRVAAVVVVERNFTVIARGVYDDE